jgi:hypothetical protein
MCNHFLIDKFIVFSQFCFRYSVCNLLVSTSGMTKTIIKAFVYDKKYACDFTLTNDTI